MRNCICHDLPTCKTGYGIRELDVNGVITKDIHTGLTRREAVAQYWLSTAFTVRMMGNRRTVAERSWKGVMSA